MKLQTCYKLVEGMDLGDVEALLSETHLLVIENPISTTWVIYDTFDWRLYNRTLMLRRSGNTFMLAPLEGGEILVGEVDGQLPSFSWEFPAGDLQAKLEPILQERALLELARVQVEETSIRILNKEEKTVARLIYAEICADRSNGNELPVSYLSLQALRGYDKQARRVGDLFGFAETVSSLEAGILGDALEGAGVVPNNYSSQLEVQLDPDMRADEATKKILRRLLETMRANEAGIRADTDTEFLHDYRVAVRRTRAALSQISGVFPQDIVERYKQDFRSLGSLTSELRDLDVYLLAEQDYRAMLPDSLRDDIAPLFDLLRRQRVQALERVIQGLDGRRYEEFITDWEAFISQPVKDEASAPNAGTPIIDLARKRIYQRYKRIVRDGNTILEHTEDELLHALRLECKKLRYLLEFFANLFPSDEIASMISQLKRLQDNLGEFTDLSVQQEFLLMMAEGLDISDAPARRALVATGYLVETMARRQEDVKAHFAEIFTEFASSYHQRQFRKLFGKKRVGKS